MSSGAPFLSDLSLKNSMMEQIAEFSVKPGRAVIEALRETVARLEGRPCAMRPGDRPDAADPDGLRFGIDAIDRHLPGLCLAPGLHEIAGDGRDLEHATAPALLAASLLSGTRGGAPIVWVVERDDLFAPGLAAIGLDPGRVVVVEAGCREALASIEEAARTAGLAGVVGELSGRLDLTASRRLHLAAEASRVPVLAIRRPRTAPRPGTVCPLDLPNASLTRWRIACLPSRPADPIQAGPFCLGIDRAVWRLELIRARGAAPASWTVEAFDAAGRLALVSPSRDRSGPPASVRRLVGAGAARDRVA